MFNWSRVFSVLIYRSTSSSELADLPSDPKRLPQTTTVHSDNYFIQIRLYSIYEFDTGVVVSVYIYVYGDVVIILNRVA